MNVIIKDGFYTVNFGTYETHFLYESHLIAYLAGIDLKIQQN